MENKDNCQHWLFHGTTYIFFFFWFFQQLDQYKLIETIFALSLSRSPPLRSFVIYPKRLEISTTLPPKRTNQQQYVSAQCLFFKFNFLLGPRKAWWSPENLGVHRERLGITSRADPLLLLAGSSRVRYLPRRQSTSYLFFYIFIYLFKQRRQTEIGRVCS